MVVVPSDCGVSATTPVAVVAGVVVRCSCRLIVSVAIESLDQASLWQLALGPFPNGNSFAHNLVVPGLSSCSVSRSLARLPILRLYTRLD